MITNCSFWCLFYEMKVTYMPIAWHIFWLFTANVFCFSSLVVAYTCTFCGNGVQNGHISRRQNSHILLKNLLFEAYFRRWKSLVCQSLILYSDYSLYIPSFLVFTLWHTYMHIPILPWGSKRTQYQLKKWSYFAKK